MVAWFMNYLPTCFTNNKRNPDLVFHYLSSNKSLKSKELRQTGNRATLIAAVDDCLQLTLTYSAKG